MKSSIRPRFPAGPLAAVLAAVLAPALLSSCAVLSAGKGLQNAFMAEEDPLLAATALPTLMKLSEALLEGNPRDQGAIVQTASLYIMYGSAFIEGGAESLPSERFEEKRRESLRAKALYKRAFRLLGPALERRAPGLQAAFQDGSPEPAAGGGRGLGAVSEAADGRGGAVAGGAEGQAAALLGRFGRRDLPLLYWSAASLLAAYSVDPLELETAARIGLARALLDRALAIDPSWDRGSLQELALSVYASFPSYLGGSLEMAEGAYRKALELTGGESASLHVSYAATVCVVKDDYPGFKASLEAALRIDPALRPEARLATVLAQEKARRMLARVEDYFFIPEEN